MINRITLLVLALLIGACVGAKTQFPSDVDSKDTTIRKTNQPALSNIDSADEKKSKGADNVTFVDLRSFDNKFSKALKKDQDQVEIKMIAKFSPNDIPERLGKWLYMVDKKGGKVEVKSTDPASRGIPGIGAGIGVAIAIFKKIRESIMYKPSKNYDATLYYDPATGMVERVVFTHKPEIINP